MTERLSGAAARALANASLAGPSRRTSLFRTRQTEVSFTDLQTLKFRRLFASTSSSLFTRTPSAQAGGYKKEFGRQKRHEREALRDTRLERRKEKDNYRSSRFSPSNDRPRNPEREELEAQIQAYMAATGPKGERLSLKEKEKLLKIELGTLDKELDKVEKKTKADEETAHLPPLDDHTLEQIYQALMLPPPPTEEEKRLARLAFVRREQKLLESVRGRKELEQPTPLSFPLTLADRSRSNVSRNLKQKLIDATVRSRILLPPTRQSEPTAAMQPQPAEEEPEDPKEMTGYIDLSALPRHERQEVRLQQLFARLAVVQSQIEPSDSLQSLKSSLAKRIAKILETHQYQLPTPPSEPKQPESEKDELVDEASSPDFEPLRLDLTANVADEKASTPHHNDIAVPADAEKQAELLIKAESMLQNLGSLESRSFMLDGIERLLPKKVESTTEDTATANQAKAATRESSTAPELPLGVASPEEWTALSVSSARADDWASLSRTLSLMERSGHFPPPLALYNNLLDVFASKGDVSSCLQIVSMMTAANHIADNYTYHCLTKVYVETAQFARAIELLNSLEEQSRPAAMTTYTLLISKLINYANPDSTKHEHRPELQSLAWSVFHHMRLVAHPVPDAPMYALMIRACASGIPQPQDIDDPSKTYTSMTDSSSQSGSGFAASVRQVSDAERALDLFREMTTRYNVRPNAEVYNSLILACARRKDFYLEAFRLLREMVGLENERVNLPSGASASLLRFAPDRYTFNALLQGCAKNHDLPRARWVLAEMIRTTLPLFDDAIRPRLTRAQRIEMLAKRPNMETLCHLFYTYASFVPTIKRQEMRLQDGKTASPPSEAVAEDSAPPASGSEQSKRTANPELAASHQSSDVVARDRDDEHTTAEEAAHVFSALVPQTSADVISEARSLFARVLADQPHNGIEGSLGAVQPGIRLVNAYIAVLASHLEDKVKARILGSVLLGDPRTGLLEKAALVLRSGTESTIDHERTLEESLIARLGLSSNEHTFRLLLHTYSLIATENKQAAQELAEQVQTIWAKFNDYVYTGEPRSDLDQRQIKLCWTSYIHFWAKHAELRLTTDPSSAESQSDNNSLPGLDMAMAALQKFAALYPPRTPKPPRDMPPPQKSPLFGPMPTKPKLGARGDKTARMLQNLDLSPLPVPQKSLETLGVLAKKHNSGASLASGASAKGSSTTKPASEGTTDTDKQTDGPQGAQSLPTLAFVDVELLHHRLLRYSRVKDIAYLTWFLRRSTAASRPRKMRL